MPNDGHCDRDLAQDAEAEAVRNNLRKLLRLLAKEVARRLAHTMERGDIDNRPRPK